MQTGTIKDSALKELENEIRKFNLYVSDFKKFHNTYDTYREICKDRILQLMDYLEIDKMGNIKRTKRRVLPSLTIKEIKQSFQDETISDLIVANVDIEKTLENIKLFYGYPDKIAKGVLELLLENKEYEYEDIEVIKVWVKN